jgi:hypothetical protein
LDPHPADAVTTTNNPAAASIDSQAREIMLGVPLSTAFHVSGRGRGE